MDINNLLIFTSILLMIVLLHNNNIYENYEGQITKETCVQRMLDNECIDPIKKQKLNQDCSDFQLRIEAGLVNINCDDKLLFDSLLCNKMITEGACDCVYGRKQIKGLCNKSPINISCPKGLKSKDVAIINKIKDLQEESKKCKTVAYKEVKLAEYIIQLNNIIKNGLSGNKKKIFYLIIIVFIGLGIFFIIKKK